MYRLSEYEYQSAINKALGWTILRDEISFSDFEAIVKDNTACATIVESYTYSKLEPKVEIYPKQQESSIQSTMHSWTYNIAHAVSYAERNYNVTSGSPFGYSPGENCQNFASQCVWAGLGSGTGITALPAVSRQRAGSNARNVWCRNQSTTHYSSWWFNWAWDNVRSFFKLIDTSTISQEGPCGFVT